MIWLSDFFKNNAKLIGWLTLLLLVVFNVGIPLGAWTADNATWVSVDGILVMFGFISIRGSFANAAAGLVDLGPTGLWIEGHRTYLTGLIGTLYNTIMLIAPSLASSKWILAVNVVFAVFGFGFLSASANTLNVAKMKAVANGALRLAKPLVIALMLLLPATASSQTFDYVFKPRPHLDPERMKVSPAAAPIWAFQANFDIQVTQVQFGKGDVKTHAQLLNAAGPALSLSHMIFAEDGSNYVDYSLGLAAMMSGTTDNAPVFTPKVALLGGFWNNIVKLGVGYDLVDPVAYSRVSVFIAVGVSPFNN